MRRSSYHGWVQALIAYLYSVLSEMREKQSDIILYPSCSSCNNWIIYDLEISGSFKFVILVSKQMTKM